MMAWFDVWPSAAIVLAPLFLADGVRHGARGRAVPLRRERPLPRRPVRDPVRDADLAVPLRRRLRDQRASREVAVAARAQPDDGRHQPGSSGASSAPAPPELGEDAGQRRRDRRRSSSSGSGTSVAPSPASRTRSDAPSRSRPRASRRATASASCRARTERFATRLRPRRSAIVRREHGAHFEEIWALRDVSFEVRRGPGARRHRPERRRQVDAAQDPHPDHDADERAAPRSAGASGACSRSAPASTPS